MKGPNQGQQKTETYTRNNLASQFFSNFIDNSQIDNSVSQISEDPSIRINQSVDQVQMKAFQMKNLLLIWSTVSKRQYIDRWVQNKEYVKSLEKRTPQFMTKVFLKIFYTIAVKLEIKYSWVFRKIQKQVQNRPIASKKHSTENISMKIQTLQQLYSRIMTDYYTENIKRQAFEKIHINYKFKNPINKINNILARYFKVQLSMGWIRITNFISFQNKLQILAGTINLTIHPPMRDAFWCIRKQLLSQNKVQNLQGLLQKLRNQGDRQLYTKIALKEPVTKSYQVKTNLKDKNVLMFQKQQNFNSLLDNERLFIQKPLRNLQIKKQINDFSNIFSFQQITSALLNLNFPSGKSKNLISLAKLKRKNEEHSRTYQSLNAKLSSPIKKAQFEQPNRKYSNKLHHRNLSYQKQQITKQRKIIINYNKISKVQKHKKQHKESQYLNYYVDKTNLFTKKYAQKVKNNTSSLTSFRAKIKSINQKDQNQRKLQLKKSKSIKILQKQSQQKRQPYQSQDGYQFQTIKQQKNKKEDIKFTSQLKGQYFHFSKSKNK